MYLKDIVEIPKTQDKKKEKKLELDEWAGYIFYLILSL